MQIGFATRVRSSPNFISALSNQAKALGFALGYTYWFKYIIITPNQLTAAALVLQYWVPATKVNPGVFITVFLVLIVCINYFGVRLFGEIEFWLSSIKILTLCGVILLSLILALGGGPEHDRKVFEMCSEFLRNYLNRTIGIPILETSWSFQTIYGQ
jgi:amino acid permease